MKLLTHSRSCFILLSVVGAAVAQPKPAAEPKESPAQTAARTKWWREAKFGMFIHWGVYSVPADATDLKGNKSAGEWYFYNKQKQVKDYEKFAQQFVPVKFDAKKWVKTAKDAGMKYIVITSKHHDGFCMFDSALTDYCITKATPFHRDPMKELAEECRKQGVRLCFYHSIMDWHHQDYVPRRPWEKGVRDAQGADLNRYIDYMKGQLTELLTNYGPIGGIWFDGGWEHNAQELHSAEVNTLIRKLQPGILINDRNQLPEDYSTPEQTIPANALPGGRLWETCMTMNDTWGYARNDNNWKSTDDLVHKLCDIASKGGNFLMNVGPTDLGEFPAAINERLAQMGQWMKVNSKSIYGTSKSPWTRYPFDGRATVKGNSLYVQVFKWPDGNLVIPGLKKLPTTAHDLATGQPLMAVSDRSANPSIQIPKPAKVDPYATVIELKFAGSPEVENPPIPPTRPNAVGSLTLKASAAEIHGNHAQYEHDDGQGNGNIGFWTDMNDYVTWPVELQRPGRFRVELSYACENGSFGSTYEVVSTTSRLSKTVSATGGWMNFKTENVGSLSLLAGRSVITVRSTAMPRGAVMNLKELRLIPSQ